MRRWRHRRRRALETPSKRHVAGAARLEGLREFAKDAAAYALSFPLRLAFRAIFGTVRLIRRLRGKKALPAL